VSDLNVPEPTAQRFIQRFEAAFGRRQSMLLKLAGFRFGEVSAAGAMVSDSGGGEWIDFGSFGVHLLGHRHPRVVEAVATKLTQMGLSTKILGSDDLLACAQSLTRVCGSQASSVVFTNSGSEAIEVAIRLANIATGRDGFAALEGGYHGKTLGAAALTDSAYRAAVAKSALTVTRLPRDNPAEGVAMLRHAAPAALFIEPIQGEGGVRPIDEHYLRALRHACREAKVLFVADEIQTGLGRTGLVLESHRLGLDPDIVVLGKVLSGGLMPVAATLFDRSSVGERAADPILHSSTFAGGALAAAAARAVVDLIGEDGFLDQVNHLGAVAAERLERLDRRETGLVAVRQRGLMIGLEFETAALCGRAVIEAARRRLLVTFCLNEPKVMRVYPPAVISEADLLVGLALLNEAIGAAFQESRANQIPA
jgi:acetylornithine aminotransferase/putrescine aminotransferase